MSVTSATVMRKRKRKERRRKRLKQRKGKRRKRLTHGDLEETDTEIRHGY
jgi:hypothetical protein